jgi:hypothetical protein
MYQSEQIGELAKALAEAQGKFTFALKASTADMGAKGGRRKYADLQSVIDAIKPHLTSHGLAVVQATMPNAGGISLRTTLMHSSGQWIAGQIDLPIDRMGGIQGMGSALTYARRYALSAMVGIASDEDDDGEASMAAAKKYKAEQVQQVRQQATANNPDPATEAQIKAIMACLQSRGFRTREDYLAELGNFLGRPITSSKELTRAEASDFLEANKPESAPIDNPFA